MRLIDPNYINDEKYIPYEELTADERKEMLSRYNELYSYYRKKAEVIDARGFCPMDILHEIILTEKKQAWSTERTLRTMAIRESKKQSNYLLEQKFTDVQPDIDLKEYVRQHEDELSRIFKMKTK